MQQTWKIIRVETQIRCCLMTSQRGQSLVRSLTASRTKKMRGLLKLSQNQISIFFLSFSPAHSCSIEYFFSLFSAFSCRISPPHIVVFVGLLGSLMQHFIIDKIKYIKCWNKRTFFGWNMKLLMLYSTIFINIKIHELFQHFRAYILVN